MVRRWKPIAVHDGVTPQTVPSKEVSCVAGVKEWVKGEDYGVGVLIAGLRDAGMQLTAININLVRAGTSESYYHMDFDTTKDYTRYSCPPIPISDIRYLVSIDIGGYRWISLTLPSISVDIGGYPSQPIHVRSQVPHTSYPPSTMTTGNAAPSSSQLMATE